MRFSDTFIDDLRDRIRISDAIGSRVDWDRKKSKPNRGDYWFCCPVHGENNASAHCDDRKGIWKCFGCDQGGDVFGFFMKVDGVTFPRAVEIVAELAGVPIPDSKPETGEERRKRQERAAERARQQAQREISDKAETEQKIDAVRAIWSGGVPIAGTPAEAYLMGRSIPKMEWPPSIRFHRGLMINGDRHPAMICGVQNKDRKLVAVWRIFLKPDGSPLIGEDGRKVKLGLGPAGGGAVRLGPAMEEISVCEGVETGFGVGCLTAWKRSVWPLLSTSGMTGWEPPAGIRKAHIYADGDRAKFRKGTEDVAEPPGRVAANKLKEKLEAMGIEAIVNEPPAGSDWLDVWRSAAADRERARNVEYPE